MFLHTEKVSINIKEIKYIAWDTRDINREKCCIVYFINGDFWRFFFDDIADVASIQELKKAVGYV